MKRQLLPLVGASVFALFHVLTLLLLQAVPGGGYILYGSTVAYIWFFSVAGTLLYAAVGYCVGVLLRALMARIRSK